MDDESSEPGTKWVPSNQFQLTSPAPSHAMIWIEIWFWLSALGIVYVYLGYPLLVGAAARVFGRPLQRVGQLPRSISIVIAAHDEEAAIVRRIRELNEQLSSVCISGEIIVVSDGSTDITAGLARSQVDASVQVVEL